MAGGGGKTVFEQMVARMPSLGPEALLLPHRVWKVKFVGEERQQWGPNGNDVHPIFGIFDLPLVTVTFFQLVITILSAFELTPCPQCGRHSKVYKT